MHAGPLQQGLRAQIEGLLYTALHGVDLAHRDNFNEAGVQGTSVQRGVLHFRNLWHFCISL